MSNWFFIRVQINISIPFAFHPFFITFGFAEVTYIRK